MCEMFGISSKNKVSVNDYLREFARHSVRHPNGWGLAVFYGNSVSLEKEPVPAFKSVYLRERLRHNFRVQNLIAHIRLATRGSIDFENCHPFVKRDCRGRVWTLIHNGTIFNCPLLDGYVHRQEGSTDSERILLYLIDCIDNETKKKGEELSPRERFSVFDHVICRITPKNKVNLIIYDSDIMYVHTNFRNTLYIKRMESGIIFSTTPLDGSIWEAVPFTTLLGFRDGERILIGTNHGNEYIYDPQDMHLIFLDYAKL